MYSKPIHSKKHEPETSNVFSAEIKIIDQSTAQRSPRRGRGVEYFRRKDCAITAPAGCQKCSRKHHTSICGTRENDFNPLLVAAGMPNARVTYPAVVVEVEGVKCRALLDTGSGKFLRICSAVKPNFHKKTYQRGQENRTERSGKSRCC